MYAGNCTASAHMQGTTYLQHTLSKTQYSRAATDWLVIRASKLGGQQLSLTLLLSHRYTGEHKPPGILAKIREPAMLC